MKKNKFKKIFVVFSLCVFLLSLFSISSFALNISDVHTGYLYKFSGSLTYGDEPSGSPIDVNGYLVNKSSGDMIHFTSLSYLVIEAGPGGGVPSSKYYSLKATTVNGSVEIVSNGTYYDVYIDYSKNTVSKSSVETIFSRYWNYTVEKLDSVQPMFDKASIALNGGTNGDGVAYDGLLGMVAKFGKFLVSTPLLLVLCIALPLVSFSVGLIIRIKNRA